MAEDPVTIVKGGTLAQNIIGTAPEGMLIAPSWKRVLAFMLDVVLISIVLSFFTGGQLTMNLLNIEMLTEGGRYTATFFMNWFVFAAAFYLYFKYTGQTIGRSLGQRGFRIAIVHDNGTVLEQHHWGPRAVGKMIYIIPFIGWLYFGLRDTFSAGSTDAEYRTAVDRKHHTVAAVDWSLPAETRLRLR
ncbi:MAG: RDD family protein [Candidatus Thermoplasmatota archaeon]|nr:RDD family protein [Candidatus Thermoplasmatota archaeon]